MMTFAIPFTNASAPVVPSGILTYTEINLSSSWSSITSPYVQQLINLSESNAIYGSYLSYNTSSANFEYFYNNGTIIPSWIESNTTGKIITWLKIRNITSIGNIYLGFALKNKNILSGSGTSGIGEAPQLSKVYAQYDDGSQVFNNYWNFTGTSLPSSLNSLSNGGTYSINNGLTMSIPAITPDWEHIFTTTQYSPNIIETYISNFTGAATGEYGIAYTPVTSASGGTDDWQTAYIFDTFSNTNRLIKYLSGAGTVINSSAYTLSTPFILSGVWPTTGNQYLQINYNTKLSSTDSSITISPSNYDLFISNGGNADAVSITIKYLRSRATPPNNLMPIPTFNTIHLSLPILTITPSTILYGSSIIITASCPTSSDTCAIDYPNLGTQIAVGTGTVTYTYSKYVLGAGTYSSFYANDITSGLNTTPQTLTISKNYSNIFFISKCSQPILIVNSSPNPCITKAQIPSYKNQTIGKIYLNNVYENETSILKNTTSYAFNTSKIGHYIFNFTTAGNQNYSANTILYNTTDEMIISAQNTIGIKNINTTSSPYTWNTLYPIKISAKAANTLNYTLFKIFSSVHSVILANVSNLNYIPLSSQPTGNYIYSILERQIGNPQTINITIAANTLNMTSITLWKATDPTTCIQYLPCLANATFSNKPSSWSIITANQPIPNQHTNTTSGEQFDSSKINIFNFSNDLNLTYSQFNPAITFTINAINNPSIPASLSFIPFNLITSNTIPSAPTTRKIAVFNNFYALNATSLFNVSQSYSMSLLINNYTTSSASSFINVNKISLYAPSSTYQNPTIAMSNITITSAKTNFFKSFNNYCPTIIGSNYSTFNQYLVDGSGQAVQYSVLQGSGFGAVGDYMIFESQYNGTIQQVGSYLITSSSAFDYPTEAQNPYKFVFLSPGCRKIIYTTPLALVASPYSITLPLTANVSIAPELQLNATCKTLNTTSIQCTGYGYGPSIHYFKIDVYNVTGAFGSSDNLVYNVRINASSFTKTISGLNTTQKLKAIVFANFGDPVNTTVDVYYTQEQVSIINIFGLLGPIAMIITLILFGIFINGKALPFIGAPIVLFALWAFNILSLVLAYIIGFIIIAIIFIVLMSKDYK